MKPHPEYFQGKHAHEVECSRVLPRSLLFLKNLLLYSANTPAPCPGRRRLFVKCAPGCSFNGKNMFPPTAACRRFCSAIPRENALIGIFLTKMSLREWSCDIPEEREERFGTGPREAALHTVKRGHAQLLSCGLRHLCGASATRPAQRHSREPSGDRTV